MDKQELEKKIEEVRNVIAKARDCVKDLNLVASDKVDELKILETELAELADNKTGEARIGDDMKGVEKLFMVENISHNLPRSYSSVINALKEFRAFYDETSAKKFALKELELNKNWCKEGVGITSVLINLDSLADKIYKKTWSSK